MLHADRIERTFRGNSLRNEIFNHWAYLKYNLKAARQTQQFRSQIIADFSYSFQR